MKDAKTLMDEVAADPSADKLMERVYGTDPSGQPDKDFQAVIEKERQDRAGWRAKE